MYIMNYSHDALLKRKNTLALIHQGGHHTSKNGTRFTLQRQPLKLSAHSDTNKLIFFSLKTVKIRITSHFGWVLGFLIVVCDSFALYHKKS